MSSDFNIIGSEASSISNDDDKVIDIKKVGNNYINMKQEYTDQSFVLSFVQSKSKLKSKFKFALSLYSND